MTDGLASAPVASGRDWYEWHDTYEDADSTLARRLTVIQGWLRQALDQLPAEGTDGDPNLPVRLAGAPARPRRRPRRGPGCAC